jgi:hypothetical protein
MVSMRNILNGHQRNQQREFEKNYQTAMSFADAFSRVKGFGHTGQLLLTAGVSLAYLGFRSWWFSQGKPSPGSGNGLVITSFDPINDQYERFYHEMTKKYGNLTEAIVEWNKIDDKVFWNEMAQLQNYFSFTLGEQLVFLNIVMALSPYPKNDKFSKFHLFEYYGYLVYY